jgi:hypothetical protein
MGGSRVLYCAYHMTMHAAPCRSLEAGCVCIAPTIASIAPSRHAVSLLSSSLTTSDQRPRMTPSCDTQAGTQRPHASQERRGCDSTRHTEHDNITR